MFLVWFLLLFHSLYAELQEKCSSLESEFMILYQGSKLNDYQSHYFVAT